MITYRSDRHCAALEHENLMILIYIIYDEKGIPSRTLFSIMNILFRLSK